MVRNDSLSSLQYSETKMKEPKKIRRKIQVEKHYLLRLKIKYLPSIYTRNYPTVTQMMLIKQTLVHQGDFNKLQLFKSGPRKLE